jgi:hypothetical protein
MLVKRRNGQICFSIMHTHDLLPLQIQPFRSCLSLAPGSTDVGELEKTERLPGGIERSSLARLLLGENAIEKGLPPWKMVEALPRWDDPL